MYKNVILISFVALSIITQSCDNECITLNQTHSATKISSPAFTDTTTDLINNTFNQIYGSSSRAITERTVKNSTIIYDTVTPSQIDTAFIITNYNNGGFTIVEKNKNAPKVIALSDQGEFNIETETGKFIIRMAKDARINNSAEIIPDPLNPEPIGPTPDYIGMDTWHGDHYCGPHGYYTTIVKKNPLIKTTWDQGLPYEYTMSSNGYVFTGCGPLAVAQVLNYFQKPSHINGVYCSWPSFQNEPEVTFETPNWKNLSNAFLEIAKGCQASKPEAAVTISNVLSFLQSIGYTYAFLVDDYDETEIIRNLKNNKPVIIRGFNV